MLLVTLFLSLTQTQVRMPHSKTYSETDGVDLPRLRQLLERLELVRVVDAIRDRLERGGAKQVSIPAPTEQERRALDELLGRPPGKAKRLSVPLAQLESVLRNSGIAPDLETAIAALRGPLRDRPGEREAESKRWRSLFERHRAAAERLGACAWLQGIERDGLLKRIAGRDPARADTLLGQSMAVLQRLPAQGIALSTLAADCLGDAHGLDPGRPAAALVRRALMQDSSDPGLSDDALWATAGVLVGGGIASTALILNLTTDGDGVMATCLRAAAGVGEPMYLTLRQLLHDRAVWRLDGDPISICENPAVVAEAANRLGAVCRPLICTRGQPSAAVTTLLSQLRDAGALLRYHGDFDWAGIQIANGMIARHGAAPWRMSSRDYLDIKDSGKSLNGDPVAAVWDTELTSAMCSRGHVIEEERVLAHLLDDLRRY